MIHSSNPFSRNIEILKATKQTMSFRPNEDYEAQRLAISAKFRELIKIPEAVTTPLPIAEAPDTDDPRFDEIRFLFESEPGFYVPAHLVYPKQITEKIPLVICLQGHSPGMHVSLAREKYPGKAPTPVEGDRDFCIQAVARGYAALALEQRGFGELNHRSDRHSCHELVMQAMLTGRTTLLGERLLDISNAITAVGAGFDFIDMTKIGIMGNSGGGTSAYYASCVDERIKVTMPSSSFCSYIDSWGSIYHCSCSYIPGILDYFDMADLAVMIAPRYLIAVNGKYDELQPFEAAQREFHRVKEIYSCAGFADRCELVVGPEGHRFYADLAWGVFDRFINA